MVHDLLSFLADSAQILKTVAGARIFRGALRDAKKRSRRLILGT